MPRAKITKSVVDRLPPLTWLWCTALSGFGCRRQKDAIVYYIRWQQDGRQRMRALGKHGPLTSEAARTLAKTALGELAAGRDPFPATTSTAEGETFGGQVPRFLERQRRALKPRSMVETTRDLRVHAVPLDAIPLSEIGRREIAALLADSATAGPTRAIMSAGVGP